MNLFKRFFDRVAASLLSVEKGIVEKPILAYYSYRMGNNEDSLKTLLAMLLLVTIPALTISVIWTGCKIGCVYLAKRLSS